MLLIFYSFTVICSLNSNVTSSWPNKIDQIGFRKILGDYSHICCYSIYQRQRFKSLYVFTMCLSHIGYCFCSSGTIKQIFVHWSHSSTVFLYYENQICEKSNNSSSSQIICKIFYCWLNQEYRILIFLIMS